MAARAVRERAHAPYSRFRVGAALRDEHGSIHAGCNVENAAYPVGTCAEAGAIAAMVASGGRRIAEILVCGDGAGLVTDLYNQKEIWPIFGYEGESFSQGGYIYRGFDDIDWL